MRQTFLTIVLTVIGVTMFAATPPVTDDQHETPAEVSYYYEQAMQALEEGNIPQAVADFTMSYAQDDEPEYALEQLKRIKKKYGNEVDIPLLDMLQQYHDLKYSFGTFIMADRKGKYGALNAVTGEEFLPFVYDGITPFEVTYWMLEKNGKKGLFNVHTENVEVPIEYDDFFDVDQNRLHDGYFILKETWQHMMLAELIGVKKNGKSAIMEMESKDLYPVDGTIEELYMPDEGGSLRDALVLAKITNSRGESVYTLKTLGGKTLVGPELNCAEILPYKTYIQLRRQDPAVQYAIAKADGTIMEDFAAQFPRIAEAYIALVDRQNTWSVYNLSNWQKVNLPGQFDNILNFCSSSPVFAVSRGGKWALCDVKEAKYLTEFNFPVQACKAEMFSPLIDLMGVQPDEKASLEMAATAIITIDGMTIWPSDMNGSDIMCHCIKGNDDAMFMNMCTVSTDGKMLIRPEYGRLIPLSGNRYFAQKIEADKLVVLDRNGNKLADTDWDNVDTSYLGKNMIIVRKAGDELYGIVDQNLKVIVPCEYSWDEVYYMFIGNEESEQ